MARDKQIKRFRRERDRHLARAERARRRHDRRLERKEERRAARALRTLRRNRRQASWYLRKIRHRRKVLRLRRSTPHGLVWFDGKKVAAWIATELAKARAGHWKGYVVSGWRDPVYSESLCYAMCGKPACPGLCAGRASNHSGIEFPAGAADVTDYETLQAESERLGLKIKNDLPRDRVHFSSNGH